MPGGPRNVMSNIPKTFTESVMKPAGDQLAEAIEQGVSDTFGISVKTPPLQKPVQQDSNRVADENRRRQNILRYFDSLKANAQDYRQKEDIATQKKRQEEIDKKQKIQQFQYVEQKRQARTDVYRAQRKSEIKVKGG